MQVNKHTREELESWEKQELIDAVQTLETENAKIVFQNSSGSFTCPICAQRLADEKARAFADASQAYGVVSEGEYEALRKESEVASYAAWMGLGSKIRPSTLFYVDGSGTLLVRYDAKCDRCGFSFEYRDSAQVW